MNTTDWADAILREHIAVCEELLQLEACESAMLAAPADPIELRAEREALLQRLNHSLAALKEVRRSRQAVRNDPNVSALLRAAQEIITKTIALGRENERARLLRGLLPPKHLPPPQRERPHFVAELYRRNGA